MLDGYQFAQTLYAASPTATAAASGTADPIGLTGDGPVPTTALVSFNVQPLIRQSGETNRIPDLIALSLSYFLGPGGLQYPFPTLAIVQPTADGITIVYTTDFLVRGPIRGVFRLEDAVVVLATANLPTEGACCPTGTEIVRLAWRGDRLEVAERCIRADPRAVSCIGR